MKLKMLCVLSMLSIISHVYAAGHTSAAKIDAVFSLDEIGTFVIKGDWTIANECSTTAKEWVIYSNATDADVLNEAEHVKAMYSMAMMVYAKGDTVSLYADGCHTNGWHKARAIYVPHR